MSHLARYRVPETHLAETVKGGAALQGSVHHPEMSEFTALIARTLADGTHDIALIVPGKPELVHVAGVAEGDGPGTLTVVSEPPAKRGKKAETQAG